MRGDDVTFESSSPASYGFLIRSVDVKHASRCGTITSRMLTSEENRRAAAFKANRKSKCVRAKREEVDIATLTDLFVLSLHTTFLPFFVFSTHTVVASSRSIPGE
jgi:hypothetical protein